MVGREHRVAIVLHHDDRVPEIPQTQQGRQQPLVVPVVEPDRRLIEDVEDADQLASDLRGQPDPLGLPPRQGPRGTIERQVGQPHVATGSAIDRGSP